MLVVVPRPGRARDGRTRDRLRRLTGAGTDGGSTVVPGYRADAERGLGRAPSPGYDWSVAPWRHRAHEGYLMDLTSFLVIAVALLIVFSGYFLFNDVPRFGRSGRRRR